MTKTANHIGECHPSGQNRVIDAKIWDPNSQGIEISICWTISMWLEMSPSFQGALQVSIKRVRKAREGEYIEEDYLPVSERNIDEMYRRAAHVCA